MKSGDTYRNFVVKRSLELPEIESQLIEVEHKPTGASIMMIVNDDDENVFNICFRTCPSNSKGVAHVLEHMALCGSKNYPVKDPFFSMTRRSLNTFMNAFTGADFTCYPASSQIPEDFYHLLSVYIDAVFYPLLTKNSFLQEGWRYEFDGKQLSYTGVVFNEMKGALMSGEARLAEILNATLFPAVTYGVNSGGDPKEIVSLTHEEVIAFHRSQYTLGRALFYFYGNIKPSRHLDFLEEKLLRHIGKSDKTSTLVPLQKRFKEPVRSIAKYPSDGQSENEVLFGLSWLTCSILEQQELLALHVIDLVLMGTDAAPLKRRLLESGFCKQAEMSIDSEIREIPVAIVCKGCSHASAQKLEAWIMASLEEIAQGGIPAHLIEGAVHQLELTRKEITGYSLPYGLSLFFRSGLLKLHGGNAEDGLRVHSLFEELRQNLKQPDYLIRLLRKYFLDNPHFTRVILLPDRDLVAEENREELAQLRAIQEGLSLEELEAIRLAAVELEAYQSEEEDLDKILPSFSLDKVPFSGKEYNLEKLNCPGGEVFHHACFTNDLIFAELVIDLPPLSVEEMPWLRLLVFMMLQLGVGKRSYRETLEFLLEHTGGVDVAYELSPHVNHNDRLSPSVAIRGKALASKSSKLFEVIRDALEVVDFTDKARLKELLVQHNESLVSSVRNSPMGYAISAACADKSVAASLSYTASGLPYVWRVRELIKQFDNKVDEIISRLEVLHRKCFAGKRQLVISSSASHYEMLRREQFYGVLDFCAGKSLPWVNPECSVNMRSQGFLIPVRAAFNAMAYPLHGLAYDHPDAAVLTVAAEILDNVSLHTKIREQGGAYGSGAVVNLGRGAFYCYSYRDPEIDKSRQAFLQGIKDLREGHFSVEDIHEGILGVIQSLDGPVVPGGRASTGYYRLKNERVPAVRQAFRRAVLATTKEQVCDAVSRYLQGEGTFTSFAGEAMLQSTSLSTKPALP